MNTRSIKYILLFFIVLTGFQSELSAQKKGDKLVGKELRLDRRMQKADVYYNSGEYSESIKRFTKLLKKLPGRDAKAPVYYKIGDSYFHSFDYRKARTYLKRASKYQPSNREAWMKHAECLKIMEKFEEAIAVCDEYVEINGEDTLILAMRESILKTEEWLKIPTRYEVKPVRDFNSRDNDFSPFIVEKDGYDHIYFSTNRKGVKGKRRSQINGQRFSDIMVSKMNRQGEWGEIEAIDSLNTEFDDGTPFVSSSGAQMYYTACKIDKVKKLGCQVYIINKTGTDWMNPERVPLVGDSISIGHPCFSPDGNTIYFASRMTGGFGGSDIWYAEKDGGSWSSPKNMGPYINSSFDELFPFMRADSTLYFSSDRFPNMGGLDLFQAKKDGSSYKWIVENMKYPFSSAGNDFGLYYYASEEKGYFTSDRKGSKAEDIYYFEKPPLKFAMEGFVKEKETLQIVDSAIIHLIGSDGTVFTDTSDVDDGYFDFNLKANTDYVFVVNKPGYFNGKARFTTDTLYFSHVFEFEILLESYNRTFEIPNIEFEFGSKDLTKLAKHSLDSLVQVLNDNPNIVVELSAHTDMVGSEENNQRLSDDRANAVRTYLISRGILEGRLTTVGYGEMRPIEILEDHPVYNWLNEGDVLTPAFIEKLKKEQQKIANQMNRRTELRVIAHDFVPSLD